MILRSCLPNQNKAKFPEIPYVPARAADIILQEIVSS